MEPVRRSQAHMLLPESKAQTTCFAFRMTRDRAFTSLSVGMLWDAVPPCNDFMAAGAQLVGMSILAVLVQQV